MVITCLAIGLLCSLVMGVFCYWLGRCGRRLPVIDDKLPWTMSRDEAIRCSSDFSRTRKHHLDPYHDGRLCVRLSALAVGRWVISGSWGTRTWVVPVRVAPARLA